MQTKNIVRDSAVASGKALIKDTNVTVGEILKQLASGATVGEIRQAYPQLTEGLILEAIAFAADEIQRAEDDAELHEWTASFIEQYRPALEALAKK